MSSVPDKGLLSTPVLEAIERFKNVLSKRVSDLEQVGLEKGEGTGLVLDTFLCPKAPSQHEVLLLQKNYGIGTTKSAVDILAIKAELQKWKRQGHDVPTTIHQMASQISKLDLPLFETKKRKREPTDMSDQTEQGKRMKMTPAARYMERYKKRKVESMEEEQEQGQEQDYFGSEAPVNKKFRFMNYKDPILHIPDPISFAFEDPFSGEAEVDHNSTQTQIQTQQTQTQQTQTQQTQTQQTQQAQQTQT
eukprot:TRINITY_DN1348_c1_g1_i1.p1 TRINITY_DN1348_c1_g1~~TRINITY_DN1348_c1_g1_i1.p1  ORF type:complete len:248 (-),score=50.22 TRINITY_DN1348_c1_g1_i1:326-1069(-)